MVTMWKLCSQAQMTIILLCPKPVVHLASHLTLYRQLPHLSEFQVARFLTIPSLTLMVRALIHGP